ncbi:MAG: RnfH family protein [Gammaproteobacteria bacterium]|nr:RnfH family protein [Gammaproteobacteria bacterium]
MGKIMDTIAVEVACVAGERRRLVRLSVERGARVADAIRLSGLPEEFTDMDLARHAVGVFGRRVALDRVLEEGDRIEIYRPLRRTPMEARRIRARQPGR